jgi:hypothetical protein
LLANEDAVGSGATSFHTVAQDLSETDLTGEVTFQTCRASKDTWGGKTGPGRRQKVIREDRKQYDMKNTHLITCIAAALLSCGATLSLRAADSAASTAESQPSREELREKLKKMTPEERQAALKEWREKHPEAAARIRDARKARQASQDLTPEQREARVKERRATAEAKVAELNKKKAAGTITSQETQQLDRMERILKGGPRVPPRKSGAEKKNHSRPADATQAAPESEK